MPCHQQPQCWLLKWICLFRSSSGHPWFWITFPRSDVKYHIEAEKKIVTILQTIFSNAIAWKITFAYQLNFIKICSLWSNHQLTRIGPDNALASNWRQANILTNTCLVIWCKYVSLGVGEFQEIHGMTNDFDYYYTADPAAWTIIRSSDSWIYYTYHVWKYVLSRFLIYFTEHYTPEVIPRDQTL